MFGLAVSSIECVESNDKYGRFVVEPLEKGFGTTVGNALRRVLLSYLPGAAVTSIRIEGVQHEFAPIPYVKEDVLEFILNIKSLRLKALSERPGKLTLEKQKEGKIFAGDINQSTDFEIVNPDLYLATVDSPEARFFVDLDVEIGMGFKAADSTDNMSVGTIPIDAIFSPVRKVNYNIQPIHVGETTSRERLYLEVWTDGTITPADAISNAANILLDQIAPFVEYSRVSQVAKEKKALRASIPQDLFNMPVEQLDLSVRAMNCLRRSGISTVGELVSTGEKELLSLRNFGQKSRQEVQERLKSLGLSSSINIEEGEEEEEEILPVKKGNKKKESAK
ncbi:MAG: DNA-directed RNA polymerase subunit alpha [Dehalococcoidales bacterium]|nr:DNA-directed RNA polymerase subunit alpha [Dehalococcoidales bacterium]